MFMVFTTAAYDDHRNIVLLAFEIIEKIIRDYFPYITETETTTFTDCVNCLIAFTNSRFNKEISLNAIAFLRVCATKLAEGDLGFSSRNKDKETSGKILSPSPRTGKEGKLENGDLTDKEDHLYFCFLYWPVCLSLALIQGLRLGRVPCKSYLKPYAIMATSFHYLYGKEYLNQSYSQYLIMYVMLLILQEVAHRSMNWRLTVSLIKMHGFMKHAH